MLYHSKYHICRLLIFNPLIFMGFISFWSCQKEVGKTNALPAFYHWKTHLNLTSIERAAIDSLRVKKLYVKFFDVDWDIPRQAPVPLAEVQIDTTLLYSLEIVPTIFLTNRTFLNLEKNEVEDLAEKVMSKISDLCKKSNLQTSISEIQMDCDWTQSTREKYFYFLELLGSKNSPFSILHSPFKLSSTIRLHQLKYPEKTGVPPVDRGMLMAYNMDEVKEWETENSILDIDILESYLPNHQSSITNYALPLDLALPIFRWGVVFRGNLADESDLDLAYLINDLGAEDLVDTTRFAKLKNNRFEVLKNTYLEGYYLYEKDKVRLETVSPEALEKAADRLAVFNPDSYRDGKSNDEITLSFYHLDTSTLKAFDHEKLEKVLEKF